MTKKRLFFSLEGVDVSDDEALAAFALHVWERASTAFGEGRDTGERASDNGVGSQEVAGDSHE